MSDPHDNSDDLTVGHGIRIPRAELRYSYSRSGGPGGQNVNKVATKAELRFAIIDSDAIPEAVKQRFIDRFGNRVTKDGEVLLTSEQHRSQRRNADACAELLSRMLVSVARPPKKRKKTKPSRAAKRRRLEAKRRQSDKKKSRKSVDY